VELDVSTQIRKSKWQRTSPPIQKNEASGSLVVTFFGCFLKNLVEIYEISYIEALLSGYWLSDLSNFPSYIYTNMNDIKWVGFYLSDGKELKLGPFMGNPACLKISFDKDNLTSGIMRHKLGNIIPDMLWKRWAFSILLYCICSK